jgi:hypothetical protein|eukprot:COSAG02_NODE_1572_length_11882_cov_12.033353_2_plen_93_part_00
MCRSSVYLANNRGVIKDPCRATVLDHSRTTHVTIVPTKFVYTNVSEWLDLGVEIQDVVSVLGNGSTDQAQPRRVHATLGPGDAAALRFTVAS